MTTDGLQLNKFNRQWQLKLETAEEEVVTLTSPLTVEFNIVRNTLASANTASFSVKNLSKETRDKIYKDLYDVETFRAIQFLAGYDDLNPQANFPMLFNGTIKQAYNNRKGGDVELVAAFLIPFTDSAATALGSLAPLIF